MRGRSGAKKSLRCSIRAVVGSFEIGGSPDDAINYRLFAPCAKLISMTKDVLRFLSSYSRSSHPFSFPSLLLRSRRRFPSSSRSGEAHMSTHAICQAALSLLNVHTHAFSPSLSLLIPSHRRRAAPPLSTPDRQEKKE